MTGQTKTEEEIKVILEMVNASPFYHHMCLKVQKVDSSGSEVIMDVQKSHLNVYGITHGGAIASLADTAASLSLIPYLRNTEYAVTQNLDTRYLKPGKKGSLKAIGKLLSRGKHSAVLEVNIFDESGETIAHAHTINIIQHMG